MWLVRTVGFDEADGPRMQSLNKMCPFKRKMSLTDKNNKQRNLSKSKLKDFAHGEAYKRREEEGDASTGDEA